MANYYVAKKVRSTRPGKYGMVMTDKCVTEIEAEALFLLWSLEQETNPGDITEKCDYRMEIVESDQEYAIDDIIEYEDDDEDDNDDDGSDDGDQVTIDPNPVLSIKQ